MNRHPQGRVARRLIARLRGMGLDLPEDTALLRVHPSPADRANGAWSWFALPPVPGPQSVIGSHRPMGELLRAPRLEATRDRPGEDCSIEPTDDLTAPAGQWLHNPVSGTQSLYEPYPRGKGAL